MANPFHYLLENGQPSDFAAKHLELLLSVMGSPLPVAEPQAEHDAQWLTHAQPLTTSVVGDQPAQLDWNTWSQVLVMTIGAPGEQVRYMIGRDQLFHAFRDAERLTRQHQAEHELTFYLTLEQLPRFRDMVEEFNEPDEDYEPISASTAMFYEEHPDLAPWADEPAPISISEEREYGDGVAVRLWVPDASTAAVMALRWEQLKAEQQTVEGSQENG